MLIIGVYKNYSMGHSHIMMKAYPTTLLFIHDTGL